VISGSLGGAQGGWSCNDDNRCDVLDNLLSRLRSAPPTDALVREAVAILRQTAEPDVVAFLVRYGHDAPGQAAHLAPRALRTKPGFMDLLTQQLRTVDASSARYWLEVCEPRIGPRGTLAVIERIFAESPTQGRRILYFARAVMARHGAAALGRLDALDDELERVGPEKNAAMGDFS